MYMVEPTNGVTPDNHFDRLLKFLKNQEEILEGPSEDSQGD